MSGFFRFWDEKRFIESVMEKDDGLGRITFKDGFTVYFRKDAHKAPVGRKKDGFTVYFRKDAHKAPVGRKDIVIQGSTTKTHFPSYMSR